MGAILMVACRSPSGDPATESASRDPAWSAQIDGLRDAVSSLEAKIDGRTVAADAEHGDHGTGSPAEAEILKSLQGINRRLLAIEQRVSPASSTAPVDPEVLRGQLIEVAKKALADDPSIGPGYVTSAKLVEVVADDDAWMVRIKFKRNRADKEVLLARIRCTNQDRVVACVPPEISPVPAG